MHIPVVNIVSKEGLHKKAAAAGLFLLIFPPHLLFLGFTIKTVYIFIGIPGIIGFFKFLKAQKTAIVETNIVFFMLFALFYFILFGAIHLFGDLSVISQLLMGFLIFFSCYYYVGLYRNLYKEKYIEYIFDHLNIVCFINAVIVILTFLFPWFKNFLYSFIGITATAHRYLFEDVAVRRFQGIVPSGFSFLSTTHALLLISGMWVFFFRKRKQSGVRIFFFTVRQIVIFLSILLIGRTGIIIILFFSFFLIIYQFRQILNHPVILKRTLILIVTMLALIIIGLSTINLSKYRKSLNFAFELFITLKEKHELDRSTSGIIKYHFIWPKKVSEIVVGSGNFGRTGRLPYINSDVGYVLFVTGAGIIGMIIGYSFYFAAFFYSVKYRRIQPFLSWFIMFFIFLLFILNLKDYYFIGHVGYSQFFFILVCVLGSEVTGRKLFRKKELQKDE